MIGLLFLASISAYVALWWLAFRKARNRREKVAAAVIALAIPFWDVPIGYANFQRQCSADGGLHVLSKLRPIDAVLIDPDTGLSPEFVSKYGFRVVEFAKGDAVTRFSFASGRLSKSTVEKPMSSVQMRVVRNQRLPWNMVRNDVIASRIATGEVVAKHTDFRWLGPWWQAAFTPMLGYGTSCFVSLRQDVLEALARGS